MSAQRSELISRVRAVRLARGLSQAELARRAGITRQALSAIEAGHYLPNTAVALRLARALGCRVEDLFGLTELPAPGPVELAGPADPTATRLVVVNVRGRWVGHPLGEAKALQEGFVPADGLLRDPGRPELTAAPERLERTALVLGCDPALSILAAHVERRNPEVGLRWLGAPSGAALAALAQGHAHVAGSHLPDPDGREYNLWEARRILGFVGGLVVAFAAWELGFAVRPGNPKGIRDVTDLARPDVRLVNREPGSGSRVLLDGLLARAGVEPAGVAGYGFVVTSHLAVARVVAGGGADAGVTLRAAARALGLEFVPLAAARFDLLVPADLIDHPAVRVLLDVLQTRAFRAELGALPGYDVSRTGAVLARVPAAA
jgi:molybdate-binding protein/DNA-binding XRE family transcriptional regulator